MIHGFIYMIDTSIEPTLGIELPVACTTIAGNAEEGRYYITNKRHILEHHSRKSNINLADAKYDEHHNYKCSRSHSAIPIISYNPMSENLSEVTLREKGYDQNGWPYALCGTLTPPNGMVSEDICRFGSFLDLSWRSSGVPTGIESSRHFAPLPYGMEAERTNSTAKDDFCILGKQDPGTQKPCCPRVNSRHCPPC